MYATSDFSFVEMTGPDTLMLNLCDSTYKVPVDSSRIKHSDGTL